MESPQTWEILLVGALAILLIFVFRPGLKTAFEQSRRAPRDWAGLLLPLALVTAFVILLLILA
jgi:NhaP-type Na+/H+ or K+/H+ antiporter